MLFAFSSTVKFSKIVFSVWNFVQSLKYFVLRTEIITVSRCESLDLRLFFTSNWVPDSVEIRQVYSAEIVSNLQKGLGKKTRLKSVFT